MVYDLRVRVCGICTNAGRNPMVQELRIRALVVTGWVLKLASTLRQAFTLNT